MAIPEALFWMVVLPPLVAAALTSLAVALTSRSRAWALFGAPACGAIAAICVVGLFLLWWNLPSPTPPPPGAGNPWGMGGGGPSITGMLIALAVFGALGAAVGCGVTNFILALRSQSARYPPQKRTDH